MIKGLSHLNLLFMKSKFLKNILDLQEDEMQFTNENFKTLYYTIIDSLNQTDDFVIESFVNH